MSTEPPRLEPAEPRVHLRLHGRATAAAIPGELQNRAMAAIRAADWHFQAGARRYQEGDEQAARKEFDRAVDLLLSAPENLSPAERAQVERRLDELVDAVHRYDLTGLGAADVASDPGFEKPPIEDIPPMTFPVDPRLKDKLQEQIRATASQLPLEVNDAVLGYINYFSSDRGYRILQAGLRRAGRYRELIHRILDEEGVPQELIFLAQAESGFLPRAVSRKQAVGMWQFVRARGNQYGLMQTPYFDDRLDPEKATRAAARHLRDLYQQFGDWYLAMAAYNCGPGVIEQGIERTGYADFWELRRRNVLPKETSNYVPIILAVAIMVKNAAAFGLDGSQIDPPLKYDTIEMTAPTSLLLVADILGCPLTELRELNPALLKSTAPAGYSLRVPKGAGGALASALETVPPEHRQNWRAHRVTDTDTLNTLARKYRTPEAALVAANRLNADGLQPGDLILIPVSSYQSSASGGKVSQAGARAAASRKSSGSSSRARRAAAPRSYRVARLNGPLAGRGTVKR